MRALATGLFLLAGAFGPASSQTMEMPGHVRLNEICETPRSTLCVVRLSIDGAITDETARSFASLLDLEQKRTQSTLKPIVTIHSTGGDVQAAMAIGRDIRRRTGTVSSNGPCHSACVFVAMGGVERNIAGIGLHRPYFVKSDTNDFHEADARYKKMQRSVVEYMGEMNISDALMRMMFSVPPGDMRLLPPTEARTIGLNGVDPAYDEFRTGQEAAKYGVSSAELRRRHAALETQCGREAEMRSLADLRKRDECRASLRERILWDSTKRSSRA